MIIEFSSAFTNSLLLDSTETAHGSLTFELESQVRLQLKLWITNINTSDSDKSCNSKCDEKSAGTMVHVHGIAVLAMYTAMHSARVELCKPSRKQSAGKASTEEKGALLTVTV
jgi:hypothetical protein